MHHVTLATVLRRTIASQHSEKGQRGKAEMYTGNQHLFPRRERSMAYSAGASIRRSRFIVLRSFSTPAILTGLESTLLDMATDSYLLD
jgi:hypothetical protein